MTMTNSPRSPRRCLLIAPLSFYSFHKQLADALTEQGYEVTTLNEEYPENVLGKLLGKLRLFGPLRRLTLKQLQTRIDPDTQFDLALIVKGRGLGPEALRWLKARTKRIVGYNFDSFAFNPSPLDWKDLCDRYTTFDPRDAAAKGVGLVHLFAAVPSQSIPAQEREFDLSAVMRVHSDRLRYLDQVMRAAPTLKARIFLFESSKLSLVLGILRSPGLYWKYRDYISLKPISYAEAMAILRNSRLTLDYPHPDQAGLTVRCFEARSMGVGLLTSHPNVAETGLFDPDAIVRFPIDGDAATLRAALPDAMAADAQPVTRDLNTFLADLIGDPQTFAPPSPPPQATPQSTAIR